MAKGNKPNTNADLMNIEESNGMTHYELGVQYYKNALYREAYEELKRAVELGHIQSCSLLGDLYRLGRGVGKQYGTAIDMYKLAITLGADFSDPYYGLGWIYHYGEGYQDYNRAKVMYEKAIKLGCGMSCNNLARSYYDGTCGLSQDYVKAKELYELGASRGNKNCKKALQKKWFPC